MLHTSGDRSHGMCLQLSGWISCILRTYKMGWVDGNSREKAVYTKRSSLNKYENKHIVNTAVLGILTGVPPQNPNTGLGLPFLQLEIPEHGIQHRQAWRSWGSMHNVYTYPVGIGMFWGVNPWKSPSMADCI